MRQERKQILDEPPNFKNKTCDRYDRPVVREVEDKLEKKKIMDEVKSEIKRKEINLKDKATENRLRAFEKQKQ